MKSKRHSLFNPLTLTGLAFIVLAFVLLFISLYFIYLSLYFLATGIGAVWLSWPIRVYAPKRYYRVTQIGLSSVIIATWALSYLNWNASNQLIFPKNLKTEALLVFGMEGYPELPDMVLWKRKIEFPSSGLIITSTKKEDIPWRLKFSDDEGQLFYGSEIDWHSSDYPTILSNQKISYWRFTLNSGIARSDSILAYLANEINAGRKTSAYEVDEDFFKAYLSHGELYLQNKDLAVLPNGLETLDISSVNLTGNRFAEIPHQLFALTSLTELRIGHNPIHELPEDLSGLRNLEYLSINHLPLTEYPNHLDQLSGLKSLDISDNELQNYPVAINQIPHLQRLRINDNDLSTLMGIKNADKLTHLDAYSNNLTKVDADVCTLKELVSLQLFGNKIDSIPASIGELTNLEKLEIWSNPIQYIHPSISRLTKLKTLRLDDNYLNEDQKEELQSWLPNCQINFQTKSLPYD